MPGKDNNKVATTLRRDPETQQIPILMLTARAKESDIVEGFAIGADDYMTKPFSPQVLLARVEAVLRRAARGELTPDLIESGPVTIDVTRCLVTIENRDLELTRTEFRLLHALVVGKGRALTRTQLMQRAIGPDVLVTDRTIDVHVTSLRKKLGSARDMVQTVRGVGYKLAQEYVPQSG